MAAESSDRFTKMPYKKGAFISLNPRGLDCKSTEKQILNNLTKIKRCSYTIRMFNSQAVLPYMGYMDIGMCNARRCGLGPFWSEICLWIQVYL